MQWLFRYADPSIDWTYAMVGLVVRFIGVFVVMAVMQIALQVAARAVNYIERRRLAAPEEQPEGDDNPTVAAIALALELERSTPSSRAAPATTSAWAIAGRLQQIAREPRR